MNEISIKPQGITYVQAFSQIRSWLHAGVSDFKALPVTALAYGFILLLLCYSMLAILWITGLEWMLLPATAGAMLIGPILSTGLYLSSRKLKNKCHCTAASPSQIALVGVILMALLLIWFRAAIVMFAIYYGLKPFPGIWEATIALVTTFDGFLLLISGVFVGGLFASLAMALSFFSIPMLSDRKIDGFTAMGLSFSKCTHNFKLTAMWGTVVVLLLLLGLLTGLLAMVVIFPVLGFATWHAYDDLFNETNN